MQLSRETRWILRNQYQLLGLLDPDLHDYCDHAVKVLEHGYEFEYEPLAENIMSPMPEADCLEVIDILEMHRELGIAYDQLADKSGIEEHSITFGGFDGNHETKALSYAHYLIRDEGKWQELAEAGDGLNSHMPTLETYRRMLAVWREARSQRDMLADPILTADDLNRIAAARIHPSRRPDASAERPAAEQN